MLYLPRKVLTHLLDGPDGVQVDGLRPLILRPPVHGEVGDPRGLQPPAQLHRPPLPIVVDPDLDGDAEVVATPVPRLPHLHRFITFGCADLYGQNS